MWRDTNQCGWLVNQYGDINRYLDVVSSFREEEFNFVLQSTLRRCAIKSFFQEVETWFHLHSDDYLFCFSKRRSYWGWRTWSHGSARAVGGGEYPFVRGWKRRLLCSSLKWSSLLTLVHGLWKPLWNITPVAAASHTRYWCIRFS